MSRNPLYFFKSKHGVYLLRCSLPQSVYKKFGVQREIKISLRTKSRREADIRYPAVLQHVNALIKELLVVAMNDNSETPTKLDEVIKRHKKKIIVDDLKDINEEQELELISLKAKIRQQELLLLNKDTTINALSCGEQNQTFIKSDLTLARAITIFFKFRKDRMGWAEKTKSQRKSYLKVFANIIGQKTCVSDLDRNALDRYQSIVRKLPKNFSRINKLPSDLADSPQFFDNLVRAHNDELIGAGGVDSHFRSIRPFLEWCHDNEYILKPHTHLLQVTSIERERSGKGRDCFSKSHLSQLFGSYIYSENLIKREKPKPFHFWMPFIALWTGARVNELAQLVTSDIKQDKGIYYIDINDKEPHKSLKNKNSKRRIPVAQALIDAGFIEFVQSRMNDEDHRIFNELPPHRDGYGREVSRWFNENYKHKCGIVEDKGKQLVFHSFRHTFITVLGSTMINNSPVEDRIIYELVGHDSGKVTHSTYGHGHTLTILKQAIDSIDFGILFDGLCFAKFKKRRK